MHREGVQLIGLVGDLQVGCLGIPFVGTGSGSSAGFSGVYRDLLLSRGGWDNILSLV